MRWIYTGGTAVLLVCMALLSGCTAGNETAAESAASQIIQPSQSEEVDKTAPDTEDITYEYTTEELYAKRDDNQIYGVIYIPQGADEQMPAVNRLIWRL